MGGVKRMLEEAEGYALVPGAADGKFVCADCFTDSALQHVVREAVESEVCSFCEATSDSEIAAPLEAVMKHIGLCLLQLYENAADGMGFDSAEGGYQGQTFDSSDLLDHIGMSDYVADGRDDLLDAILDCLDDRTWCEKDPYALRPHEALSSSWESFRDFIKHERRFFSLQEQASYAEGTFGELLDPGAMLRAIVQQALKLGSVTTLDQGTRLYRARQQKGPRTFRTPFDLGAPPARKATQSNRMSPPGVVMTYVSEDALTALKETVREKRPRRFRVGTFELLRAVSVLDLTRVPPIPSIFDLDRAAVRDAIIFLRAFAKDMSKPIIGDDRVHVEYVPTQVVTEYVRVSPALRKAGVEGVRYASAQRKAGVSLVLFGGRDLLHLTAARRRRLDARERRAASEHSPLLRLVGSTSRTFP